MNESRDSDGGVVNRYACSQEPSLPVLTTEKNDRSLSYVIRERKAFIANKNQLTSYIA